MVKEIIDILGYQVPIYKKELNYENAKVLDKATATRILLNFRTIAIKHDLDFLIFYGTLLGAYRENDFIAHDTDIDIIVFDELRLVSLLYEFEKEGLLLVRYEKSPSLRSHTTIFSLQDLESEIYIDVYIAYQEKNGKMNLMGAYLPYKMFNKRTKIQFLGVSFNIPQKTESILKTLYGKQWKTPIEDQPGDFKQYTSLKTKVKRTIKRIHSAFQSR